MPQGESRGLLRVALGLDQQLEPRGGGRPEPGVGGFLGGRGRSPPPALAPWACHEARAPAPPMPEEVAGPRHWAVRGHLSQGVRGGAAGGLTAWRGVVWRGVAWRGVEPGLAGSWPGCGAPSSQGQALQLPPTQAWVPRAGRGPTRAPQRARPGAGGSGSEPQALPSHPCAKASLGDAAGWGRGGCPECSWGAELGRVPRGLTLPPATSKCLALWTGLRTLRPVLGGTSSRVSWCPVASSLTPGQWPQAGSLRRAPGSRPAPHVDAPCFLSLALLPREPVSRLCRHTAE